MKNFTINLPLEAEITDFNFDLVKSDVSLGNDKVEIEYTLEFDKGSELHDDVQGGNVIGTFTHKFIENLVAKPVRIWVDGDCVDIPDFLLEYAHELFKTKQDEITDKLNDKVQ